MLRAEAISKSFGARVLLDAVDLHIHPGDRIGLIGRNGEGKSTLLRMLAGLETWDSGRLVPTKDARVGYLRQEIDPSSERSVIAEVRSVHDHLARLEAQLRAMENEMAELEAVPDELAARYDRTTENFRHQGGFEAEAELRTTLAGLGFSEARWNEPLRTFSGGWLMRVELAKLLLSRPDVLLLDEPTNHLDLPSIAWFEGVLAAYSGAIVVVSHDRTFLDRHATRIAELDRGRLTVYRGNYSEHVHQKAERNRVADARRSTLERQINHAQKFVDRFGAKATKASQAESRKKKIEKLSEERDALAYTEDTRRLRFRFRPAPRSGDLVLRMEGVGKAYGEQVVYRDLDFEMRRGDRIALVGPNGAGKSTLLRLVAGALPFEAGERAPGHNVELAFYAQHQLESLSPGHTVLREVESAAAFEDIPRLRSLLGAFLFSGDDVEKKVSVLSGGEKARVALAKLLLGSANFLVLDEPTNHLDMQARDVLTDALREFDGTLLFISHDRSFIGALANQVVEVRRGAESAVLERHPSFEDYRRRSELAGNETRSGSPEGDAKRESKQARSQRIREQRRQERDVRRLRESVSSSEAAIERAEAELERLGWLMAEPEMARDGERLREIELERRAQEEALARHYAEWERLAAELEEVDSAD